MMGIYQSISVIGSLIGTIVGGFLLDLVGFRSAALFLGCGSSIGISLTILLRNVPLSFKSEEEPSIDIKLMFRDFKMIGIGLGTSMNNLLIGSLLTSTLSLHLLENYGEGSIILLGISMGVATLSSLLVAIRRISRVIVGPFIGTLSDLVGRYKIVLTLFVLGTVSMMFLGLVVDLYLVVIAVLLAFVSSTAIGVVLATEVSDLAAQDKNRFLIINSYINWVDLGSAIGPLIAYILRLKISFQTIYLGASVILSIVTILIHYTVKKR
jgi:MFS family permease